MLSREKKSLSVTAHSVVLSVEDMSADDRVKSQVSRGIGGNVAQ